MCQSKASGSLSTSPAPVSGIDRWRRASPYIGRRIRWLGRWNDLRFPFAIRGQLGNANARLRRRA